MRRLILFALVVLVAAPIAAQSPAAVDSVYAAFSRAYRTYDADLLRSIYTPDCQYLPANADTGVQTCETAMRGFEAFFEGARTEDRRLDIAFRFIDRSVDGDLAYDVGYYALTATAPEGETLSVSHGKFVTVLKRQPDGAWRIHVDGYSPAPAAAYEAAGR